MDELADAMAGDALGGKTVFRGHDGRQTAALREGRMVMGRNGNIYRINRIARAESSDTVRVWWHRFVKAPEQKECARWYCKVHWILGAGRRAVQRDPRLLLYADGWRLLFGTYRP